MELFLVSPRAGCAKLEGGEGPGQAPTDPLKLHSNCCVNVHFVGEKSCCFHRMGQCHDLQKTETSERGKLLHRP